MLGLSTNPIPIKAAMKLLGRDTGELRLPMTPLDAEARSGLAADAGGVRPALSWRRLSFQTSFVRTGRNFVF